MPDRPAGELSVAQLVDMFADEFEAEHRAGRRPRLETALSAAPESLRPALFKSLLDLELELRRRAGERPAEAEYRQRFPQHQSDIQQAFARLGEIKPPSESDTVAPAAEAASTLPPSQSPSQVSSATMPGRGGGLGPYQLLEKLGEGGMGAVYKARHRHLDKLMAIKILPQHFIEKPEAVSRFKREMKAVGKLSHPNIVQAHDAGEIDGTHFLAMEYVDGTDLQKLIKEKGPLSPANACRALRQAAIALAAAHTAGLVHRDIKPSNLLVAKNGQIKVLDLGLARLAGESNKSTDLTAAGQAFGTPDYMAPEQWEDAREADPRTDLYALGCTLFFLLTGHAPFEDGKHTTNVSKMTAHVLETPADLRTARADVPEGLAAIYQRLLSKQPDDRFQNATELAEALHPFASGKAATEPKAAEGSEKHKAAPLRGDKPRGSESASPEPRGSSPRKGSSPEASATDSALAQEALIARVRSARELLELHCYQETIALLEEVPGAENIPGLREILFEARQRQFEINNLLATIQQSMRRKDRAGRQQLRAALERLRVLKPGHPDLEAHLERLDRAERGGLRIPLPGRKEPLDIPWVAAIPALIVSGLMLAFGVWVIVRDKSGKEVARVAVPEDGSATVTTGDEPAINNSSGKTGWNGWPVDAPPPAIAPFNAEQAKKHQEAWASYLKVPVEYVNSIGMKFVLIPPGEFLMGSTAAEIEEALVTAGDDKNWQEFIRSEGPQHKVVLTRAIYLGVHEVTQAQYEQLLGKNPSGFSATGGNKNSVQNLDTRSQPVEDLDWNAAAQFCVELSKREQLKPFYSTGAQGVKTLPAGAGYRLPTEAEWEFACRAGTSGKLWTGDQEATLVEVGWVGANSGGRPHAVGNLKPNPFGLFDMHGNVMEWIQDEWEPNEFERFKNETAVNPTGPAADASRHVIKGGYWDSLLNGSRSSFRFVFGTTRRGHGLGFRVAIPADVVRESKGATAARSTPIGAGAGPRRVEVKELNASGYNTSPWLSPDGLTIYWEGRKPENIPEREMWIRTARRPNAQSPFAGEQALLAGRHPTLSADQLSLAFIRGMADNGSLRWATRNNTTESFALQGVMPELANLVNVKSPALSHDGLTLVFQHTHDNNVQFSVVTRPNRTAAWARPQTLAMGSDPTRTEPLTWPYLSDDGLTIWYCHGGDKTPDIRTATRKDRQSPFENHQPVIVEGTPLIGRAPRYVPATRELFYAANTTEQQGDWSLWVIKDYQPPSASSAAPTETIVEKGWTDLFNGKDLTGWVALDGKQPEWKVEGGYMEVVLGKQSIMTRQLYPLDFELHAEFWLPKELQKQGQRSNSGIFLLGRHEIQICDSFNNPGIADPRHGCGALYGEIAPAPGGPLPPESWQTFDITVHGPRGDAQKKVTTPGRLTVIHNGKKVIDDASFSTIGSAQRQNENIGQPGPLMLQSHNSPVRFRNLRIRPLDPPAAKAEGDWRPLLDANSFARWQGKKAQWTFQDGLLTGRPVPGGKNTFLFSPDSIADFELKFQVRIAKDDNSGVQIRSNILNQEQWTARGPQADMGHKPNDLWGGLYGEQMDGWILKPQAPPSIPPATWTEYLIRAVGQHVTIQVNGRTTVAGDVAKMAAQGRLAFQIHASNKQPVEFRNLQIRETGVSQQGAAAIPADAKTFQGHSFKFFPEKLAWKEAKARCEGLGGHLAIIDSAEENAFVAGLVAAGQREDAWMGATDEAKEGVWLTVEGAPLKFTHWYKNQPNNKPPGEHYALMSNHKVGNETMRWQWSDQPNESTQHQPGYVCEWDVLPNAQASAAPSDDLTRWQGQWRLVAFSDQNGDATADKLAQLNQSMRIEGNRRTMERTVNGKMQPYSGTFRLNPAASPKEFDFDFEGASAAGGHRGLYEFDGEKLRLIYRASITEKPARAQWSDKGTANAAWFEFERVDVGWTDLLTSLDPEKISPGQIRWQRDGNKLIGQRHVPVGKRDWLSVLLGDNVDGDYDIEVDVLVHSTVPFQLDLPVRDTLIGLNFGPRDGDCGFNNVGGLPKEPDYRPTQIAKGVTFTLGQKQTIQASVRNQGEQVQIDAQLNGKSLGSYSGPRSGLVFPPNWAFPVRNKIKIAGMVADANSRIELHRIQIKWVNIDNVSGTAAPPELRAIQAVVDIGGKGDFVVDGKKTVIDGPQTPVPGSGKLSSLALSFGGNQTLTDDFLAQLEPLQPLRTLNLQKTRVTDSGMAHVARLKNLSLLLLDDTIIGDQGLEQLAPLTNLRNLTLSQTKVTDAGLGHLRRLPALLEVRLLNTAVTGSGFTALQDLPKLIILEFGGSQVDDAGLKHLAGLTQLIRLEFGRTKVTDQGIKHLKGLTNLQELFLYETAVTDESLSVFSEMKKLKVLNLTQTKVTEAGAKRLQAELPGCIIER